MEEEAVIFEPYELNYSDLMLLSSERDGSSPSMSPQGMGRLGSITRSVMENLGPGGPGLLAITGVPNASNLRQKLLPLARRLALLDADDRKRVLKEHGLGSDVPLKNHDRSVSSFAMQLKYTRGVENSHSGALWSRNDGSNKQQEDPFVDKLRNGLDNLGDSFKELGLCMMEVGHRLTQICDRAIGGQELEQSLLESCMAKGRLIHYHSTSDNLVLKEAAKRRQSSKKQQSQMFTRKNQLHVNGTEAGSNGNNSLLWQQWHFDYGLFTVLTSPMFILPCHAQTARADGFLCSSCDHECPSPSGHTGLEIFYPSKNKVLVVKAPPDCFLVQVGESAEILSQGKLRANLHSVCRPANMDDLSRETFIVFLQPAWNKSFSISEDFIKSHQSNNEHSSVCNKHAPTKLNLNLHKIVPPLSSRLKDAMTFAEFSRETTQQYYGGRGLQSNR